MRVAYVSADPGVPVYGTKGCSAHVREVVGCMLQQKLRVTLLARNLDGRRPDSLAGTHCVSLPAISRKDDANTRELKALASNADILRLLRSTGPFDMVYERYSLWSSAAMEYARESGIPGLLEVNAPLIQEQALYRTLINREAAQTSACRVFGAASALLAVSGGVREYLETVPSTIGKIHVVSNGVDVKRFKPWIVPILPAPDCITVGFVGGLKPWHGVENLVRAFSVIAKQYPQSRLLIVGDGPQRQLLEEMAAEHPDCNIVFTGNVESTEVPGYLSSMDIGVAPYPNLEGFYFSPLKVYEYMAMGLPVIASNIGDMESIIDHEVSGLLTTPGDVNSLVSALNQLLASHSRRIQMGAAGRREVCENHTWAATTRRIMDIAQSCEIGTKVAL